jgi:hypothetical protein
MASDPKAPFETGGPEVEAERLASTRPATSGYGASQMRPGEAAVERPAGRALADGVDATADGDADESHAGHGWRGRGRS